MKIACFHTAESNTAVFERARQELGLPDGALCHVVRSDLLEMAEKAGGLTPQIASETQATMLGMEDGARAVLLTCSTLGPAVDCSGDLPSIPWLRVDAALARQTVEAGGRVAVLCAVETTLESTTEVFSAAAKLSDVRLEIRLVPGAWSLFKAGNEPAYLTAIAAAAEQAHRDGATTIAFAQASMAGAAELVRPGISVLCSPQAGLAEAMRLGSIVPSEERQ